MSCTPHSTQIDFPRESLESFQLFRSTFPTARLEIMLLINIQYPQCCFSLSHSPSLPSSSSSTPRFSRAHVCVCVCITIFMSFFLFFSVLCFLLLLLPLSIAYKQHRKNARHEDLGGLYVLAELTAPLCRSVRTTISPTSPRLSAFAFAYIPEVMANTKIFFPYNIFCWKFFQFYSSLAKSSRKLWFRFVLRSFFFFFDIFAAFFRRGKRKEIKKSFLISLLVLDIKNSSCANFKL